MSNENLTTFKDFILQLAALIGIVVLAWRYDGAYSDLSLYGLLAFIGVNGAVAIGSQVKATKTAQAQATNGNGTPTAAGP